MMPVGGGAATHIIALTTVGAMIHRGRMRYAPTHRPIMSGTASCCVGVRCSRPRRSASHQPRGTIGLFILAGARRRRGCARRGAILTLAQERRLATVGMVVEGTLADPQADQQPVDLDLRVDHAGPRAAEPAVGPDDRPYRDQRNIFERGRLAPG